MRKILVIIFFIFPFFIFAQTGKMTISISSGINFSKINKDDHIYVRYYDNFIKFPGIKSEVKTNVITGINFQYFLYNKISIQTGLLYTSKGINYDYIKNIQIVDDIYYKLEYYFNSNFEYLEIPILIQYSFGNKFKFIPSFGLSATFLISQYYELKQNIFPMGIIGFNKDDIQANKFITSLKFGNIFSYSINEKLNFQLDIQYNQDLSNVFSYNNDEVWNIEEANNETYKITPFGIDADSKFRSFSISLGLAYNLN